MKVYELIQELARYPADSEVYFTAEGTVKEFEGEKEDQLGQSPNEDEYYCVQGCVNLVKEWHHCPDIQCEVSW